MKRSRFSEEQIIAILKEQESGMATVEVCRRHGISSATFYKWKAKFGGLEVSEARRLRSLEDENARLKKMLAEAMLDNAVLKDLASKKWYASVPRIGRRTRLGPQQREAAWAVFEFVRGWLAHRKVVTFAQVFARLTRWLADGGALPFNHVVVDEAQDLSVAQVRFLAEVGRARPDALFLAGDIGQRIFHLPFSWSRLGLDVRGRSHCLKVNYRTSHQIRAAADKLLPASIADLDGIEEGRRGTVSVFDGPLPQIMLAENAEDETWRVGEALQRWIGEGVVPAEIALLVRSEGQLARARAAIKAAGLNPRDEAGVAIATMHAAKGLEYRAVAVMACDEGVLPDPERLGAVADVSDLEAAYETERHLLCVACTRARDHLLVSGVAPGSEFLEDLI